VVPHCLSSGRQGGTGRLSNPWLFTGKYHLNDTMTFLWAMAFMPIFVLSAIWGINELTAYLERRKKK
jgi:hypothetical protein